MAEWRRYRPDRWKSDTGFYLIKKDGWWWIFPPGQKGPSRQQFSSLNVAKSVCENCPECGAMLIVTDDGYVCSDCKKTSKRAERTNG